MFKSKSAENKALAMLVLLSVTAIWGVAGPVIKLTLNYIPPFTLLFFRLLIVCLILLPITFLELAKTNVDRRDIPNIFLLGILGQTSIFLIFLGLRFTTALDAALISAISPILVIAAGHYFYKEKVSRETELGVIIASLGTLLVVLEPALSDHQVVKDVGMRVLGNILILLYQISWPFYVILSKRMLGQASRNLSKMFRVLHLKKLHKKYPPLLLTNLTFYVGLATIIPFAGLEGLGLFGNMPPYSLIFNPTSVTGLLYLAVFSSIIAYVLYQWSLKYIEVRESAVFTYIAPAFALPAAYLLLGEIPSEVVIVGAVVIFLGVLIAEKGKS